MKLTILFALLTILTGCNRYNSSEPSLPGDFILTDTWTGKVQHCWAGCENWGSEDSKRIVECSD